MHINQLFSKKMFYSLHIIVIGIYIFSIQKINNIRTLEKILDLSFLVFIIIAIVFIAYYKLKKKWSNIENSKLLNTRHQIIGNALVFTEYIYLLLMIGNLKKYGLFLYVFIIIVLYGVAEKTIRNKLNYENKNYQQTLYIYLPLILFSIISLVICLDTLKINKKEEVIEKFYIKEEYHQTKGSKLKVYYLKFDNKYKKNLEIQISTLEANKYKKYEDKSKMIVIYEYGSISGEILKISIKEVIKL